MGIGVKGLSAEAAWSEVGKRTTNPGLSGSGAATWRLSEYQSIRRIALAATGVSVAREDEPIADLRENISLFTATEAYAWVTRHQIWGVGTMDFSTGRIHIDAYLQSGAAG